MCQISRRTERRVTLTEFAQTYGVEEHGQAPIEKPEGKHEFDYRVFRCGAADFVASRTFSCHGTDDAYSRVIGEFEDPDRVLIRFSRLADTGLLNLLPKPRQFTGNADMARVVAEYCTGCDTYVVKDGNRRLFDVIRGNDWNQSLEVWTIETQDWRHSKIDMLRACRCHHSAR